MSMGGIGAGDSSANDGQTGGAPGRCSASRRKKRTFITRGTKESRLKLHIASAAAIAAALLGSGVARADDALQTLGGMHMTAPVDWPTVPQSGAKADAVRQILKDKI